EPALGQEDTQPRAAEGIAARDPLGKEPVGLAGPAAEGDLVADEPQLVDLVARVQPLPAQRALRDDIAVPRLPRPDRRSRQVEHPRHRADAEQRDAAFGRLATIRCVHRSPALGTWFFSWLVTCTTALRAFRVGSPPTRRSTRSCNAASPPAR